MLETNGKLDASALALGALSWVLMDDTRAERFLSLTGLTVDTLRSRIGERSLQAAILAFLEGYEPDLIACAENLQVAPTTLVAARAELEM